MVIDEAGAGLVVPCPKCARDVTVPAPDLPKTVSPLPLPAAAPRTEKEQTVALKWVPPIPGINKEKKN
jgi:hypothetical protein